MKILPTGVTPKSSFYGLSEWHASLKTASSPFTGTNLINLILTHPSGYKEHELIWATTAFGIKAKLIIGLVYIP